MEQALLIDIGSTYTKVSLLDLDTACLLGRAQSYTTVESDVNLGLKKALSQLGDWQKADYKLACSSAAGGLKMIAIGLVPDLTAEAARRAALGAGSKVLKTYSYQLNRSEIEDIASLDCDIILLAGGTDGGNHETIIHNARLLAASKLRQPMILAGNKSVAEELMTILTGSGKEVYLTENVMPELEVLNIEPARKRIREIFLEKIIQAKGLSKVNELIDGVIMPTPAAVMRAAELIAEGYGKEAGLGELMVVDIGGATTDVHSAAQGKPAKAGVNWRGLQESYIKRTVEGDLGMRYSLPTLYQATTYDLLQQQLAKLGFQAMSEEKLTKIIKRLQGTEYVARGKEEIAVESALGYNATRLAISRHVGILKTIYTPMGATYVQEGKDLTGVKYVIGTGGIMIYSQQADLILQGALYHHQLQPELLAPTKAEFLLDKEYLLAAIGLLAEVKPEAALRIIKNYLEKIGREE